MSTLLPFMSVSGLKKFRAFENAQVTLKNVHGTVVTLNCLGKFEPERSNGLERIVDIVHSHVSILKDQPELGAFGF